MNAPDSNPHRNLRAWQRLIPWARGVALLLIGVAVAAGLTIGYWWFATHVLLPTSRLREPPAVIGKTDVRGPDRGPAGQSGVADTIPSSAVADAGWWPRLRDELATTNQELATLRGTFGDMSGAVNAFFSALAFACVFYALILQRKDLRLQREELEDTRMVAVAAARLQAHTGNLEAAFQAARLTDGRMSPDLVEEITESRAEIRKLLRTLDNLKA